MLVRSVFVRFYKSFNFDYLRKTHPKYVPDPWDATSDGYSYPFVRVGMEEGITTIVGANESGKSQLLTAIECALTGQGIKPSDFCRYSQFFAVDQAMLRPDFGVELMSLDDAERAAIAAACNLASPPEFTRFALFRFGRGENRVYLREAEDWSTHPVANIAALQGLLPIPFVIDAHVPLPDSVPVVFLQSGTLAAERTRKERRLLDGFLYGNSGWFESPQAVTQQAPSISQAFQRQAAPDSAVEQEMRLAEDLLVKVARVDRSAFSELLNAVQEGDEGYANGIVERINEKLTVSLNFPRWWSQDKEFRLLVTLRDRDLVFTIRDRTGTEYSFNERSGGLRYFLSYFVQYLSHKPPSSGTRELLLMDEPDVYLSSQGQQDLLKIFDGFAAPPDGRPACQVMYVTHSPFLIDKNHGDRIRVLEKGEGEEGTRVVKNVARNHYEPLRSAFGGFAGETTFISNCNLMLEGLSDQILIAGMSSLLGRQAAPRTERLDLNNITLVPTGSASHIPYMVYLARGRDEDRPAVIVLLDSDQAGDTARAELARGGPRGKRILDERLVLQVGDLDAGDLSIDNPGGAREIEDLVPVAIALAGVSGYASEYLDPEDLQKIATLTVADVTFDGSLSTHGAVEAAVAQLIPGFHLDKVGFARAISQVANSEHADLAGEDAQARLEQNFRALFRVLNRLQRDANRESTMEKTATRIKRARHSFLQDHPLRATREDANLLFEDVDRSLDASVASDEVRLELARLKSRFELEQDVSADIADYEQFKEALVSLAYQERLASQEA